MCGAAILLFLVALWAAKTDLMRAGGLDKIVVLSHLCFAVPLAVFGAEHLSGASFIKLGVPSYMRGLCSGPILSALHCWPLP